MQRLPNVHPSDTSTWPNKIGTFDVGAANEGSKILIYNQTPLNIDLDFLNGSTDVIHAWEANWWRLDGDTKQIEWMIDADSLTVNPPPVDAVFLTLYQANENVPGTYPVSLLYQTSIGGTVSTSGNSLSNEGNPINTEVIDIGPTGLPKMLDLFNDHFIWSVVIGGVAHQVLRGQASGIPLQVGQANDVTEILGQLQIDQAFTTDNGNIGSDGLGDFTVNGNVETHKNLIPHPPTVPLAGGGGGTATLYALFTGGIKCYIIMLEAFKTGVSNQSIVLPTAFTKGAAWFVTDSPGYNIVSGGVNQPVSFMTTTQNSTSTTTGQSWNLASLIHAWDTITWPGGNANAHNGFFFIVGV